MLTRKTKLQTFASVVSGLGRAEGLVDLNGAHKKQGYAFPERLTFLEKRQIVEEIQTRFEKLRKLLETPIIKEEKELGGIRIKPEYCAGKEELVEQVSEDKRPWIEVPPASYRVLTLLFDIIRTLSFGLITYKPEYTWPNDKLILDKQREQYARNQKLETEPRTERLCKAVEELNLVCSIGKNRTKFFEKLDSLYALINEIDNDYLEHIGNDINHNTISRRIENEFEESLSLLMERRFINLGQKQNAMAEIRQFAAVFEFCSYFDHNVFENIKNRIEMEINGRRKGIALIKYRIETEDSVAGFLPKAEVKQAKPKDIKNERILIENEEDDAKCLSDLLTKALGMRENKDLLLEINIIEQPTLTWFEEIKESASELFGRLFGILKLIDLTPLFSLNDSNSLESIIKYPPPRVDPFLLIEDVISKKIGREPKEEKRTKLVELFFKPDLEFDVQKEIDKLGSSRVLAQSIVDIFKSEYSLNYKELLLLRQILSSHRNNAVNRSLNEKETATYNEVVELLGSAIFGNIHINFIKIYNEQDKICSGLYQRGIISEQKFLEHDQKLRTARQLFDSGEYIQATVRISEIENELKKVKKVEYKLADQLIKLESKVGFSDNQTDSVRLIRILADAEKDLYEERLESALEKIAEAQVNFSDISQDDVVPPHTYIYGGRSIMNISPLVYIEEALEEEKDAFAKNLNDTVYDVLSELAQSEFHCKRMLRTYAQSGRLNDREKFILLAFSKAYIENNEYKTIVGTEVDTFQQFEGILNNQNLKGWLGHNLYMRLIGRKTVIGDEIQGLSVFDSDEKDVKITAKGLIECALN